MKREKHKILIADDSEMNRSILADMLGDEYEIIEAENGVEAIGCFQQMGSEISLVLLDIVMPEMDGFGVLEMMNKYHWIEDIPVIMISAENTAAYVERAYELGVTDYISRPFDDLVVHRRVINTIMLYAKQKKLIGMVADQLYEKQKSNNLMISILSHIVEFRNGESGLHVFHIHTLTDLLLRHLTQMTDRYNLSQEDISIITMASALHDVGKIAIPEEILNKPGRLTKEEFEVIKTHTEIGATMLEQIPFNGDSGLLKVAHEICRWHHERYDGSGYPDGLKGDEIPISAQIVALADVYDALTSERVYKAAYSHETAVRMITNGECGVFNPLLLQCLLEASDSIQEELQADYMDADNRAELHNIAMEMTRKEELSASDRTLMLLEHERIKYQFFASISEEIQFEYTVDPSMVILSSWGAAKLGLKETIMDPFHDEQFMALADESTWKDLVEKLRNTTPEDPIIKEEYKVRVGGEERWHRVICRATWMIGDEEPVYLGTIGKAVDIHQERLQLMDLEKAASHDALTGLMNHAYAKKHIRERMAEGIENEYALFVLDLDYFKSANDQRGHSFGDHVLQYMAEKLKESIRSGDLAARIGGDEFLIFLEYNTGLEALVNRIYHSLLGEYEGFRISISMGVARGNASITDYDTLFHCADQALYAAKRAGRGRYCFYDESMRDMLSVLSPIEGERTRR